MLKIIGNIIWLLLGGLEMALAYAIAALAMFILIVTIPFGVQALKLASYSVWPFGRTLIKRSDEGALSVVGNVIWFVLVGWWLALGHLLFALVCAITIIGIPFAVAHFKLAAIALFPFGRDIVDAEVVAEDGQALVVHQPGT